MSLNSLPWSSISERRQAGLRFILTDEITDDTKGGFRRVELLTGPGRRRTALVNPQSYRTEVLARLVDGWPQSSIDERMPWHWATGQVH
jgi:hypothetical protein